MPETPKKGDVPTEAPVAKKQLSLVSVSKNEAKKEVPEEDFGRMQGMRTNGRRGKNSLLFPELCLA